MHVPCSDVAVLMLCDGGVCEASSTLLLDFDALDELDLALHYDVVFYELLSRKTPIAAIQPDLVSARKMPVDGAHFWNPDRPRREPGTKHSTSKPKPKPKPSAGTTSTMSSGAASSTSASGEPSSVPAGGATDAPAVLESLCDSGASETEPELEYEGLVEECIPFVCHRHAQCDCTSSYSDLASPCRKHEVSHSRSPTHFSWGHVMS